MSARFSRTALVHGGVALIQRELVAEDCPALFNRPLSVARE
jgi:hypothetical protein